MSSEPKAQEIKPVVARDGQTVLGYCQVTKFGRHAGEPLKVIDILNAAHVCLATIYVYRLHSRVHCEMLETEGQPIDSKRAVQIAQAALEANGTPQEIIEAILMEAERLSLPHTAGES